MAEHLPQIETVGVIGLGAMGRFICQKMLGDYQEVIGYDPSQDAIKGLGGIVRPASLAELAEQSDALILAVPVAALSGLIRRLKPELTKKAQKPLLVEMCSVKEYPEKLFKKHLDGYEELLHVHHLFGPQSAQNSFDGHKIFVTSQTGQLASQMLGSWGQLKLDVAPLSAEKHDKLMVVKQVIPFFVGRMLNRIGYTGDNIYDARTPSSDGMQYVVDLDEKQSEELYRSVLKYNRYAKPAIRLLMEKGLVELSELETLWGELEEELAA
ncbi:prephenate dehydrogenase [Candidatus Saccharibacteria bacterium]|nr:MAG: prephenate dehydrogenase [Candidatus Saccharibacteria bacterium]